MLFIRYMKPRVTCPSDISGHIVQYFFITLCDLIKDAQSILQAQHNVSVKLLQALFIVHIFLFWCKICQTCMQLTQDLQCYPETHHYEFPCLLLIVLIGPAIHPRHCLYTGVDLRMSAKVMPICSKHHVLRVRSHIGYKHLITTQTPAVQHSMSLIKIPSPHSIFFLCNCILNQIKDLILVLHHNNLKSINQYIFQHATCFLQTMGAFSRTIGEEI